MAGNPCAKAVDMNRRARRRTQAARAAKEQDDIERGTRKEDSRRLDAIRW
jgi:hypothetical protein